MGKYTQNGRNCRCDAVANYNVEPYMRDNVDKKILWKPSSGFDLFDLGFGFFFDNY